ncbi:MAG: universal stress protein [Myxococcota bacterium]
MHAIHRILVPVDFSEASRAALRQAHALATALDAGVEVLHVWEPAPNVTPVQLGWMAGDAQAFCAQLEGELRVRVAEMVAEAFAGDRPSVELHVEAGYVAHTILERAKHAECDLIVMGTQGRRGLSHLVLGSVAERVVRTAPCPVLTTRAPAKGDDDAAVTPVDADVAAPALAAAADRTNPHLAGDSPRR